MCCWIFFRIIFTLFQFSFRRPSSMTAMVYVTQKQGTSTTSVFVCDNGVAQHQTDSNRRNEFSGRAINISIRTSKVLWQTYFCFDELCISHHWWLVTNWPNFVQRDCFPTLQLLSFIKITWTNMSSNKNHRMIVWKLLCNSSNIGMHQILGRQM